MGENVGDAREMEPRGLNRRWFLGALAAAGGAALLPASFWRSSVFAAVPALPGLSPYGPLLATDANGLQLPAGFTSRVVATTGSPVGAQGTVWHAAPDGGGCVPAVDGGWIYVSNAELPDQRGGVTALRFAADGTIVDAYPILAGTNRNCAGGVTPWGTWLSCEEAGSSGRVFECDPQRRSQGTVRAALGLFNHEAAAVDPLTGDVYLTEDDPLGRLYRFVPTQPGNLGAGSLYAASVVGESVTWIPTSPARPDRQANTTVFNGGEGVHVGDGVVYIATKGDKRIWELTLSSSTLTLAYDCAAHPTGALTTVDNVTVHPASGRVFVAEDGGNMELGVMSGVGADRRVGAFCRVVGHSGSELAGPAFSPDGSRLYVSSQRGADGATGVTYEIRGPFALAVSPLDPIVVAVDGDTFVRGGSYAAVNYSTGALMEVCNNTSEQYARWAYLRVDTAAAATDPAVPLARAVLRVNARMWTGSGSAMELCAVASNWLASTVTWAARPLPTRPALAQFRIGSTTSTWYDLDVTAYVNELRASGVTVAAFVVRQTERNGPVGYINASEHRDFQPHLVLTPSSPPPTVPGDPTTTLAASTTLATTVPAPTSTSSTTTTSTTTTLPTTTSTSTTSTSTSTTTTSTTSTTSSTTTTAPGTTTLTLTAVGDTYVRGGTYATSTAWWSRSPMEVCNNSNDQYTKWAYIKFDVGAAGSAIDLAVLRLRARMWQGGPSPMSVQRSDASWSDRTLTWATRPVPAGGQAVAFTIVSTTSEWYAIDVTADVHAARQAGERHVSFLVRQTEPNGKVAYVDSIEGAGGSPQLVVTHRA